MDSRPVVTIVTAKTCGHCDRFKRDEMSQVVQMFNNENYRVYTIDQPNMNAAFPSQYPRDLARYVKWYPTISLFSGQSWNAALSGRGNLQGTTVGMSEKLTANNLVKYAKQFKGF